MLCSAAALWMDETQCPREGIANWVWAAVQPAMTIFAIYPTLARYVIPGLIGVDCKAVPTTGPNAAYAFVDVERRQVCWAHLLLDFHRIAQHGGLGGRIGRRLHALGPAMFRCHEHCRRLQGKGPDGLQRRLQAALRRGADQTQCSCTARTCVNVLQLWPALWAFTTNLLLQPKNNAAKQALRCLVLKRNIAGPTRSLRGDQFLARGFRVHETFPSQGRDLLEFMHSAVHASTAGTTSSSMALALSIAKRRLLVIHSGGAS